MPAIRASEPSILDAVRGTIRSNHYDDLAEEDRDAIHRWTTHLRTNDPDTQPLGTVGHLDRIRLTAERSQMPLTEMNSIEDVNALSLYLEDDVGLADSDSQL